MSSELRLARAHDRVQAATAARAKAVDGLHAAVANAFTMGVPVSRIAGMLDITRGRVYQMLAEAGVDTSRKAER